MKKLIEEIRANALTYGSFPFWSWNDKLEPEELRRQLNNMHDMEMNGAFMHARTGLATGYMSDEWFDCVDACVDEAGKLGMSAWCYDENGWPSGFGGGALLEDPANWATFLGFEESDEYPVPAKDAKPTLKCGITGPGDPILGVYVKDGDSLRRISQPEEGAHYYIVRQGYDPSYVDTLDAEIIAKFIKHTYETYKERVGFSDAMPGFFTDEPQYYRWATPWSNKLPAEFAARYGLNVLDGLGYLFVDCEAAMQFRWKYYRLLHELFINGYAKQIYDWCEKNGAQLTGHAVEESFLAGEMWCCGGVMPFYEYEHIPGVDYLGRNVVNDLAPRQLGSVCAQLGKPMAMSEMFACCGWDVSPNELKNIAEMQYAGGVNRMCQHLYPYSIRGQRKRDYPAHYSQHLPWQPAMKEFNHYFNNLGYLLSRGTEPVDVLVIHPMHSAYLRYKRADNHCLDQLEDSINGLVELFGQHQLAYHFGDEWMMSRHASVEGDRLRVGLCSYGHVVIPWCETLDASTVELLKLYTANGGKVWMYGKAPDRIDGVPADLSWLRSNCGFDELRRLACAVIVKNRDMPVPAVRIMVRQVEEGKVVYLTSLSRDAIKGTNVILRGFKGVAELDLSTLEVTPVRGRAFRGGMIVDLDFADSQSHVLIECETQPVDEPAPAARVLTLGSFTFAEMPENALTLDRACIRLGEGDWSEERPIERIRDELLQSRYEGLVSLRFGFEAAAIPAALRVCAEPMQYTAIAVNGHPIRLGAPAWLDPSFVTADIAPYTRVGSNELTFTFSYRQDPYVYEVLYGGGSESLRNCLAFDTEVEAVYLYGGFAVRTPELVPGPRDSLVCGNGFVLEAQKDTIDLTNVVADGYPFFGGTLKVKTTVQYDGGASVLSLPGRYAICEVYVNEKHAGRMLFDRTLDLSPFLHEGENTLTLHLTNSNRNLLGPHHCGDPEPYAVGPGTFSFEGGWENGECSQFCDRYAFVRFGIDK